MKLNKWLSKYLSQLSNNNQYLRGLKPLSKQQVKRRTIHQHLIMSMMTILMKIHRLRRRKLTNQSMTISKNLKKASKNMMKPNPSDY